MDDLTEVLTPRLVLRRAWAEDWEEQRILDANPEVMATLGGLRSVEETRAYMERHDRHWTEHGFGLWVITDRASGAFVGRGGLRHIELDDGLGGIELGYALTPEFWGRGLATELARAAMEIGVERLGLERIIGVTLPTNRASRRVLEKAGLAYAGETSYKSLPHVLYEWTPSTRPRPEASAAPG